MSKLDYLKELGVNAIWLAPIYKSPMHDFGFDVSDFYGIHHEYGTMEEFELLLKKAEDSGKCSFIFIGELRKFMHEESDQNFLTLVEILIFRGRIWIRLLC